MQGVLDRCLFFCVTTEADNNLMWSHYAHSHKGFCIEFDATKMKAKKVTYKDEISSLYIMDSIKSVVGYPPTNYEEKVMEAFNKKLKEWAYEEEYRYHMSDAMEKCISKRFDDFVLVDYDPSFIKSIIFGCRMNQESRDYIKENLPFKTQFKEAVEGKSNIIIRPIN